MAGNIHSLEDHPQKIKELVSELTRDLSRVDFSNNLNDLVQSRKVSMRAVWTVLENGEIDQNYTNREDNGLYLKMCDVIAGVHISIDLLIETGNERMIVLWAEENGEV